MRNWRVLTAIAAVVLAALSGVLVWQYVDDADNRAEERIDQVEVLVAQRTIQRGASGESVLAQNSIQVEKRTKKDLPPTALRPADAASLKDKFASGTIAAGQEIVASDFVAAGQISNTALEVEDGKQAITVNVDETRGVARFIVPGDTVNLIFSVKDRAVVGTNPTDIKATGVDLTAFLLPGLKVLAVGQTTAFGQQTVQKTDTNSDGKIDSNDTAPTVQAASTGLVTVEVTPRQAEQIAHATFLNASGIYLSLNPPDFDVASFQNPEEIINELNLFDQPLTKLYNIIDALKAVELQDAAAGN